MSGGVKETPRQKMVGMMYLFLTCMLAINVSDEVLDAFAIIDSGLNKTIETFNEKTEATYGDFDTALADNEKKVKKSWEIAQKVRVESDSLFNHIQRLKELMVRKVDGPEYDLSNIQQKSNSDVPAEVMIVKRKGKKLKEKINEYRDLITSYIQERDSSLRIAIEETLDTSDPKKESPDEPSYSWESKQFSHTPLSGAVALLSKMQVDVKNTESDIVNYLFAQIEAGSFKFNKLDARVLAPSSYILKGDTYKAEVFLAAVDTTKNPRIVLNTGAELKTFDKAGKAIYSARANTVGPKKWGGTIWFKTPSGVEKPYKFESEYIVAEPNVVVSPTKMNVFYVGVDNPVSLSAPGFSADRVRATMTNGKLIKRGGNYIARPNLPFKPAQIRVEAKFGNGWRHLRTVDFRVKEIPNPVAKVADMTGGKIKRNLLLAQFGVEAVMEGFDFDLEFKITGFTVSTIGKGGFTIDKPSKSDSFTPAQKRMIKSARRNQKIYIEDIKAKGPDGSIRSLPAIVFRIK